MPMTPQEFKEKLKKATPEQIEQTLKMIFDMSQQLPNSMEFLLETMSRDYEVLYDIMTEDTEEGIQEFSDQLEAVITSRE